MKNRISVTREKTRLGHPESRKLLIRAVNGALKAEGVSVPCGVDIMLTDEAGIHAINAEYRKVDSATDVLSFPVNQLTPGSFDPEECERDPDTDIIPLGDMVVCLTRCEKQGEEYGHGFERELSYLAVHSVLHLLGYDHMDEGKGKKLMRSREEAIMSTLGLKR